MAPPANRRSGYSRRAQYGTFFGYLAGALGAVAGAALLIVSIWNPQLFSSLRSAGSGASAPAGGAVAQTRETSRDVFDVITGYALAGSRYDEMRRELEQAKVQLVEQAALRAENQRLRALLKLQQDDGGAVAVTRLVASTAASSRRFATIGAGTDQGVVAGMPVRSVLGLVGRVVEAGRSSSRVMLVTDSESLVPVRRARDGVAGFAQGRADGTLQIRLIDLGINPLRKGDSFVTSGAGGLYQPNTAIGVVTSITPDGAIAKVLADPAEADYVLVERSSPIADAPAAPDATTSASGAKPAPTAPATSVPKAHKP